MKKLFNLEIGYVNEEYIKFVKKKKLVIRL